MADSAEMAELVGQAGTRNSSGQRFQHALLEYVRNAVGFKDAEHAELNPATQFLLLQRMQCSLVEQNQKGQLRRG